MSDQILDELRAIRENQQEHLRELTEIRTVLLPPNTKPPLEELDERVGKLESFRWMLMGGVIALEGVYHVLAGKMGWKS